MAINVPGQFPVGSQPVGGAIPKSSSHLYTVSVICYVIVNTQLQKTTNWFRTNYITTIVNIQKTINQVFKTFFLTVRNQITKQINVNRINYEKITTNIQKTINLIRISYIQETVLLQKLGTLSRIAFDKLSTNIQKTTNINRITYVLITQLINTGKAYFRSFVATITITTQIVKQTQPVKIVFVTLKESIQKTFNTSKTNFIKLLTNIQKTTNINRIDWITMRNQVFQKTIDISRIFPITITENIDKQINISRISYAKILTNSQKVLNKVVINFPILITSNIQKTINIGRIFPSTLIQLLATGKAYFRSFITTITITTQIVKQPQVLRKIPITLSSLLQKNIPILRNIDIVVNNLLQKTIHLTRNSSLSVFQTLIYGSAHAISFLVTIGVKELISKQVDTNRTNFIPIISQSQKAIQVVKNIPVQIGLFTSKTIHMVRNTNIFISQFIITGKAFFRSFLVTMNMITKSPQKAININHTGNIKAFVSLQKNIKTTLQNFITPVINSLQNNIILNRITNIIVKNQIQKLIHVSHSTYMRWINALTIYIPVIYSVAATCYITVTASLQKQPAITLIVNNISFLISYSFEIIHGFYLQVIQPISSRVIQVLNIFGISNNTMDIQEPLAKETSSFTAIGSSSNNSPIGTVWKINNIRGISNT